MIQAYPNPVDDQLGDDPPGHPTRAADEAGRGLQPAAEGGEVAQVPLDLAAEGEQGRAEGARPLQQVDGPKAVRRVLAVAQPGVRRLARGEELEPAGGGVVVQ